MIVESGFKCILCEKEAVADLVEATIKGDEKRVLRAYKCRECSLIQLHPPEYSLDFYSGDGQINNVIQNYSTPMEKIFEHSVIEARRRVARFSERGIALPVGSEASSGRVLDIGGGYGFFGAELKRQFPLLDVTVMEPSAMRAQMGADFIRTQTPDAVPHFEVALLNDEYVAQHAGEFDLVTLWHVLEHVPEPIELIKKAIAISKSSTGLVCVEVPNINDDLNDISSAFRLRNFMAEHISYFSPETLLAAARGAAPDASIEVFGYQRYGIFNYFHWAHFNAPQGANPDMFGGVDRWWLEARWRAEKEQRRVSDALFMVIRQA